MTQRFDHIVLIVDDEEQVGRAIGRILKKLCIRYVYAESAEIGLEHIKNTSRPFSLIISDQRMPGMQGAEFLEKAKAASPDSIRFLLTGYADVTAVALAVNKGAIHRYIGKPWDNEALEQSIGTALEQYELIVKNDRLFKLAKEQNAKLFTLNRELQKSTAIHKKALLQRDREISDLQKKLEIGVAHRNHIVEIEALLRENDILEQEKINTLYAATVADLFEQFQDIAARNGFDMPDKLPGK